MTKDDNFLDDPDEARAELDAAAEDDEAETTGAAGPARASDTDDDAGLRAALAAAEAERDELRDRTLRLLAETENMRKRAERDRREAEQYGSTKLARDLGGIYDNLRRALDAADDGARAAAEPLIEGVELTLRELLAVFNKHGIELIQPAEGDRFDPRLHQAMFEAPVPGTRAGDIIQVMADGIVLHDRLLRPAQVGVSSTPAS